MPISPRTLRPGGTFSPRSIAGLALWLDASSSDLYTTDAGPVVAVTDPRDIAGCALWLDGADSSAASMTLDGTAVSSWRDKSGNGRDVSATGSERPTLTSNYQGTLSAVTFDGGDVLYRASGGLPIAPSTTFIVFDETTAVNFAGVLVGTPSSGDDFPSTTGFITTLHDGSGNTAIIRASNNQAAGGTALSTSTEAIGASAYGKRLASFVTSSSTASARLAGLASGTPDSAHTASGSSVGLLVGGRFISGAVSGLYRFNGKICEIVHYDSALSAANIARVEAYLATKWGISGVHAPATATSDPVGYWGDKSGNGRHAVQATAARRPGYLTTDANGKPAVSFSASFPSVITNEFAFANAVTVFAVAKNTNNSFGGFFQRGTVNERHSGFRNAGTITARRGSGNDATVPFTSSDYSVFQWSFGGSLSLPGVNGVSGTANTGSNTFASTAMPLRVGSLGDGSLGLIGGISEFLYYEATLTDSQAAAVRRYLARKYGVTLTVIPTVSNADAQNWIDRVYANGGTVSSATAAAVNQFCVDIENAPGGSIRDRFLRLNLFCGSFQGAFVPLYRSASFGGSPLGNATDTNLGSPSFLVGDYSESSGLQGNGSSKYLNTGVPMNFANLRDYHMSSYVASVTGNAAFIGADTDGDGAPPRFYQSLTSFASATRVWVWYNYGTTGNQSDNSSNSYAPGLFTGVGSPTANNLYVGASSVGSSAAQANQTGTATYPVYVFASNARNASLQFPANARLGGYSLGLAMTATQVGQYNTALAAFNSAMGRA